MTSQVLRSALLPYPAASVFQLVNDVRKYPEFLPWCSATEVLEESETLMRASMTMTKGGATQSFTTRNILVPGERIEMRLEQGPFSYLEGFWQFKALSDKACKISLDMKFDYDGPLTSTLLGPLFNQATNTLVDAFCERAKQIYG